MYNWIAELHKWISHQAWLQGLDYGHLTTFFERAFHHTINSREAWFGIHGTGASLVGGQLCLAAIYSERSARGMWLLTTQQLTESQSIRVMPVKAIRNSKVPLNWLYIDPYHPLEAILEDERVWNSYAEASATIIEFGQGRGRESVHRRNGKHRLSSFWTEAEGTEDDTAIPILYTVRWDHYFTIEEYIRAFQAIAGEIDERQFCILDVQYHSPNRTSYASKLAMEARISGGYPTVNALYGRLARRISEELGCGPYRLPEGEPRWWPALSIGHKTSYGYRWEMLPEVASALEALEWVDIGQSQTDPDPHIRDSSDVTLTEGAPVIRRTVVYERNSRARKLCLEAHGTACSVCDLEFGRVYGPELEGYIHVHHIRPLATIRAEYEIDPIEHLRPVCPNCHAVIHYGGRLRSIEDVRQILAGKMVD